MGDKDIAISELAHVARKLMERLAEIDDRFVNILQQAVSNKIDYYAGFAYSDQP